MNSWSGIGRLVRDPEERMTNDGTSVASFRIAVDLAGDKGDDGKLKAGFFNCVAFGQKADLVNQYFHKGKQIGITGRLLHHEWQNQAGENRSEVRITVLDVTFVGSKDDDTSGYRSDESDDNLYQPAAGATEQQQTTDDDDDIPF